MDLTLRQSMELALAHHGAGRLDQAEQLYRLILDADPDEPNALDMLGAVLSQRGRHAEGLALIDRAIALRPDAADYHANRGLILSHLDRQQDAIAAYRRALALQPNSPMALGNLGNALQKLSRFEEAIDCYQQSLALAPRQANVHCNLGNLYLKKNQTDDAIVSYRRALDLQSDYAEAMSNLGSALQRRGNLDEAVALYRRALELKPALVPLLVNLGDALHSVGQLTEALACFDRALALNPDAIDAHSKRIYTMLFDPASDSAAIRAELRRWNDRHAKPFAPEDAPPRFNCHPPHPRLRIGYVSPFFSAHVVGRNLVPLFREHDHQLFEIYCYSNSPKSDDFTDKFRVWSDHWRPIHALTPQSAADLIRADEIDILVDLALHMESQQLLIFARRPAPVQITFAGYPGSTGLDTVDYRLTDPYLDPPENDDRDYSEKSIRLANTFWCYAPLTDEPQVNDLPAARIGHITFGCLCNFAKINANVIALWAQIMTAVPDSRLLMMAHPGNSRQRVLDQLAASAIKVARVEFVEPAPDHHAYLSRYHRIDIALDPFPYNGHTTTLDALWMGVPVISKVGDTVVGRAGLSVLSNLGMRHFAAATSDQYSTAAISLTTDIEQLQHLRHSLRDRMRASPLMEAKNFAQQIERAYRDAWTQHSR